MLKPIKRMIRSGVNRFAPGCLILMYHRVCRTSVDPWHLCVTPEHFREQLEVLVQRSQVLTLGELVRQLKSGNLPSRAVVLTFDDGYVDNLKYAKPIIEEFDAKATFLISSGYIGKGDRFWWDRLANLFHGTKELPRTLHLQVGKQDFHWERNCAGSCAPDSQGEHDERARACKHLRGMLQPLTDSQREPIVQELQAWAGREVVSDTWQRPLTSDELVQLGDGPDVEIGAHTVTHAYLPEQSPQTQKDEIEQARSSLSRILNRPVDTFSYPYGGYDSVTAALVRDAGFMGACSVNPARVSAHSDPFGLPRFMVEDWDGEEFSRQIFHWLKPGGPRGKSA